MKATEVVDDGGVRPRVEKAGMSATGNVPRPNQADRSQDLLEADPGTGTGGIDRVRHGGGGVDRGVRVVRGSIRTRWSRSGGQGAPLARGEAGRQEV